MLYRFLDSNGNGNIGFDEFTLLAEENWSKLNPVAKMQLGDENRKIYIANHTPEDSDSEETPRKLCA